MRTILLAIFLFTGCGTPSTVSRIEAWQISIGVARNVALGLLETLALTRGANGQPVLSEDLHRQIAAAVQHAAEALTQALAAWRAATEPLPPPPVAPEPPAMSPPGGAL